MQKNRFFVFLSLLSLSLAGCVPSPSANDTASPTFTDLHSFFTPQQTNKTNLWKYVPLPPSHDSLYYLEYIGQSGGQTIEGYSPVSIFKYSDSARKNTSDREAYLSDSLIKLYFGKSSDSSTQSKVILRDTLREGASWIAAENFITSNGVSVSIKAVVEDYYSETSSLGNVYKDVFLISYTSSVKGSLLPVEPEYQSGAHLNIYYAKSIGPIIEKCKNSKDSLVWTKELVETRIR